MKKIFAVFAVLVAAAVVVVACGGSSGGGGGAPAAAITTDAQAKTSTSSALGAVSGGVSGMTSGLSGLSNTATQGTAYAKRMAHVKRLQARGTANPDQAKVQAQMKKALETPIVKKAIAKARALAKKTVTVKDSFPCDSGTIDITGSDNSDDTAAANDIWSVTISFTNCQMTDNSSYWYTMSGSLTDSGSTPRTQATDSGSMTITTAMNNFTQTSYDGSFTGTVRNKMVANASMGDNAKWTGTSTDGTYSGTMTASGSIVITLTDQGNTYTFTESYNGLSDTYSGSWATDASGIETDTSIDTMNGGMSLSGAIGGTTYSVSASFGGLVDKWVDTYDANNTWTWKKSQEWMNGTFTFSQTPAVDECSNGSYVFATADATPLTWTASQDSWCPDSGEVKINTVKVTFKGSGTGTIDYGTGSYDFTGCELKTSGSVCGSTPM